MTPNDNVQHARPPAATGTVGGRGEPAGTPHAAAGRPPGGGNPPPWGPHPPHAPAPAGERASRGKENRSGGKERGGGAKAPTPSHTPLCGGCRTPLLRVRGRGATTPNASCRRSRVAASAAQTRGHAEKRRPANNNTHTTTHKTNPCPCHTGDTHNRRGERGAGGQNNALEEVPRRTQRHVIERLGGHDEPPVDAAVRAHPHLGLPHRQLPVADAHRHDRRRGRRGRRPKVLAGLAHGGQHAPAPPPPQSPPAQGAPTRCARRRRSCWCWC